MPKPDLADQVRRLPDSPGVYLFQDKDGRIIYVGKAASLRKRVSSHFAKYLDPRHQALIDNVAALDRRLCDSELAAIFLEGELIKKYQPRYNVLWRDDKSYPYLKLTISEPFPRLLVARKKADDGELYFGPFEGTGIIRKILATAHDLFPLRSCRQSPLKKKSRPCLNSHLERCLAPCQGEVSPARYRRAVRQLVLFLAGDFAKLNKDFAVKMARAAARQQYETAAYWRNRADFLENFSQRYRLINDWLPKLPAPAGILAEMKKVLGLPAEPELIAGLDIAQWGGREVVAALVWSRRGAPDKTLYRHYLIKGAKDDVAALAEVGRRFGRSLSQGKLPPPQLVLVDGGRGQVGSVSRSLAQAGLERLPVWGLAKENEILFPAGGGRPLVLPRASAVLRLLQALRDEAHRFANAFHRRRTRRALARDL